MRTTLAWLAAVVLTVGCTEFNIAPNEPDVPLPDEVPEGGPVLEFEPKVLDFGYVEQGTEARLAVKVTNPGDELLELRDFLIAGSPTFSIGGDADNLGIPAGKARQIFVVFVPENADEDADFGFRSDLAEPEASVALLGTGANPSYRAEPNPLLFSDVDQGQSEEQILRLINDGNTTVTITDILTNDPAFEPADFPDPLEIPEGETYELPVTFTPTGPGFYTSNLAIASDSRTRKPNVILQGSSEIGAPEAICSVTPNPVTAIHGRATWRGSSSFDPGGRPLTYQWTLLSTPVGSAARMPGGGTANRSGFVADVVGDYVAQLVVTNDHGASSLRFATLTAEVDSSLWVEMSWQHRGDDMDLHLIRDGGNRNSSKDCYYANCVGSGLRWGQQGNQDDPYLDLDDIPGVGPENINIAAPADGTYRVDVHDYPGSTYRQANDVRVRIYVDGILQFDDTRTMTGESTWESFARVDWVAGVATVVPL